MIGFLEEVTEDLSIFFPDQMIKADGHLPEDDYQIMSPEGVNIISFYNSTSGNVAYPSTMSENDNHICCAATQIYEAILGKTPGYKACNDISNAIIAKWGKATFRGNIRNFIVNYLSTQAFAIPAHLHAKKYLKKKSLQKNVVESRLMVKAKFTAFKSGYVPIGIVPGDKSDKIAAIKIKDLIK